jgi:hypothetical protein
VQALQKAQNISFLLNVRKIAMYLKVTKGLYDLQRCFLHTMVEGGDNYHKIADSCKSMELFPSSKCMQDSHAFENVSMTCEGT